MEGDQREVETATIYISWGRLRSRPMKPTEIEEEKSDEETAWPPIPQVISSTSSHASSILSGNGTVMNDKNELSREQVLTTPDVGRPPLPFHLRGDEQERDDIPRPHALGRREQSTGTAVSGLTEISPSESPVRGHDRKISWGIMSWIPVYWQWIICLRLYNEKRNLQPPRSCRWQTFIRMTAHSKRKRRQAFSKQSKNERTILPLLGTTS